MNIHELIINAMCEHPFEMRFGKLYKLVGAYVDRCYPSKLTEFASLGLDGIASAVEDLLVSGDIILRKAPPPDGFGFKQKWYSVRPELMRKVGLQTQRDSGVPLNYQQEENVGEQKETVG